MRKIIHIDMDAFYASVEQRDDPALRGKPIAVGGAAQRGVVAAASYEARRFGVRSAMPSITAKRLCDELIFVKARFDVYKAVSQDIRRIFAEYTPLIEPLSLDEAYLDVTDHLAATQTAYATAKEIRRRIFEATGLTASAGISYNKFFAKLASDMNKPNGQHAILPQDGPAFMATLAIGTFHGIGPATEQKMRRLGIHTGLDLRNATHDFLIHHFGKAGTWYYNIARGDDHRQVRPDRIRKSYGSEKTFGVDLIDPDAIADRILQVADGLWQWSTANGRIARTVTLKAKFNDFRQITRSKTLDNGIQSAGHMRDLAQQLANTLFPLPKPIRLLGLTLSGFQDETTDGQPMLL